MDRSTRMEVLLVELGRRTGRRVQELLPPECEVRTATDVAAAVALLQRHEPAVVVLSVGHGPARSTDDTAAVLQDLVGHARHARLIVVAESDAHDLAVRAVALGAYDVLCEPLDAVLLQSVVRRAAWVTQLEQAQLPPGDDEQIAGMSGTSASIRRIFQAITKVSGTDVPVLITGESGTGKEVTACAIHSRSMRRDAAFVTINCGAIPENLLEAELFGYERGAFTGAVQQKKGKVEYAQNGTLFLDEVGELPVTLQVKLLRFLQDRTFERVGGRQSLEINVRIMAATNVDLKKAIEQGTFREDLYYRLGVVNIHLPPLRDREEDVLILAMDFLRLASQQHRKRVAGFSKEAVHALKAYPWPGNVRELYNKVRRAVVMAEGMNLTPEDLDLPFDRAAALPPISLRQARHRMEADVIAQAFMLHRGNLRRAAAELGVSRPTLYRLLRQHGLAEKVRHVC